MIYLDHNATTPVLPEVREAMLPFLTEEFGNPSSSHALGTRARAAVDRAREQVAGLLGSNECPTCPTRFSEWLRDQADQLGARYRSELQRHYR